MAKMTYLKLAEAEEFGHDFVYDNITEGDKCLHCGVEWGVEDDWCLVRIALFALDRVIKELKQVHWEHPHHSIWKHIIALEAERDALKPKETNKCPRQHGCGHAK